MGLYYHNDQVIRQRIAKKVLNTDGIVIDAYDSDNLYPQRMHQIKIKSPLVSSAIKVLTDFINGDGFENGDDVVNSDGLTVNDILDLVTVDAAEFKGFALMLDFNLLGKVVEIQYLPFEFVRYGKPDVNGRHKHVYISNNWEKDNNVNSGKINAKKYQLFNPMGLEATEIINGSGSQVMYFTGNPDNYPLCSFDAVADAAQTDGELQTFELTTVTKGFAGVTMLKVPGGWEEGSQEEKAIQKKAEEMSGSRGGGIVAIAVEDDSDQTLLETVPADNKDRLFDLTTIHVRDIITQNYNQPGALSGVNPTGGVFTQQAYKDAFLVYNAATKNERNRVQRAFQKVCNLWVDGPIELGKIIPQKFEEVDNIGYLDGEERTEKAGRSPEEIAAQSNLRGSVGGVQGVLSIQGSVSQGITDYDSAITLLIEIFGFSKKIAIEILGEKKEKEAPVLPLEPAIEEEQQIEEKPLNKIYGTSIR
jgi:hypothetical protein